MRIDDREQMLRTLSGAILVAGLLTSVAGLPGCGKSPDQPVTPAPVAAPPAPLPRARIVPPPVVKPEAVAVAPVAPPAEPPPLPDLPPAVPGQQVEQEIEGIFLRLIDCYRTPWGVTAIITAVNREDRTRSFSIATGQIFGAGESKFASESAKISPRDTSSALSFELAFNQPVTFYVSWAGLQWEAAALIRLDSTEFRRLVEFKNVPIQDAFARRVTNDDRAVSLIRLQRVIEEGRLVDACWMYKAHRGRFQLQPRWFVPETSAFDGWLIDADQVDLKKAITGQLIPEGERGLPAITLQANPQSGHDRPATRGISTLNLLRQGQPFSVNLSLYYTELIGMTENGVQIAIRLPPI